MSTFNSISGIPEIFTCILNIYLMMARVWLDITQLPWLLSSVRQKHKARIPDPYYIDIQYTYMHTRFCTHIFYTVFGFFSWLLVLGKVFLGSFLNWDWNLRDQPFSSVEEHTTVFKGLLHFDIGEATKSHGLEWTWK